MAPLSQPSKPPVGITRLAFQSMGELSLFQMVASAALAVIVFTLGSLARALLASKGMAVTTANIKTVLLSWQGILLLVVGMAVLLLYLTIDLFAHIVFCDDILQGRQGGVVRRSIDAIRRAVRALPRFFCLDGIPTLVYVLLLVPLVGIGFSMGLTRNLYVPRFISEVIYSTPRYAVPYAVLMLTLSIVGVLHIFTLHGVLLQGLSPREARGASRALVRSHPWRLFRGYLHGMLVMGLVALLGVILFVILTVMLEIWSSDLPVGYHIDIEALAQLHELPDLDAEVILFRMCCYFVAMLSTVAIGMYLPLVNSYTVLLATHLYRWLGGPQGAEAKPVRPRYPRREGKSHLVLRLLYTLGVVVMVALASMLLGIVHEEVFLRDEPVRIVAHRLGGNTAPENSMEGLENAIAQGCYAAETDVQRTADGHYVINHDDTFTRLCHVDRAVKDMTFDEVRQLRIDSPTNPEEGVPVLTLEELLDASKGRIKLFIELKGSTADRQMVDDVVRMVRERDAVDDVALISLSYDAISYAEQTYPEFETGLLYFAGYGDLSLIQCDMLLIEEEAAMATSTQTVHDLGKQLGVWTVNTQDAMHTFLTKDIDLVITDQLVMAGEVQDELDARSDLEVIYDVIFG